jgi:signal transduction histidine kinase
LVNADARWIKQVFPTSWTNAVKYSPNGGFGPHPCEVRKEDGGNQHCRSGHWYLAGEPDPNLRKYFRVRNHNNPHHSGTGLGLPIARCHSLKCTGGRIWADSKWDRDHGGFFSLPILKIQTGPLSPLRTFW